MSAPEGGLTAYVLRVRENHRRLPNGRCSCHQPLCPQRYLLDHISALVESYELKVQDFAKETERSSRLVGFLARVGWEVCPECDGRGGSGGPEVVSPCSECGGFCLVELVDEPDSGGSSAPSGVTPK